MRQGQQNRRGRGRPNNNSRGGKGQNPLTRSHESNGPDVKIRGTPSHIAEKYITLARDSLSASDIVMAENYLQHAEHYNRIIMTYREQMQPNSDQGRQPDHGRQNENRQDQRRSTVAADDADAAADAANETGGKGSSAVRSAAIPGNEPQPAAGDHPQGDGRTGRPRRAGDQRSGDQRTGGRSPRAGGRQPRNKMPANGSSEQTRSSAGSRRRNNDAVAVDDEPRKSGGRVAGGPKISDGQEPPGFLRNSVAPSRRRRQSEAKSEPAPPVVEEDGA